MKEEMKVYIKPGCPWCVAVVGHLLNEGYEFDEIDVLRDASAFDEMKRLSGQTLAPTVVVGDLILADCGVPELQRFLKQHGIEPPAAR